MDNETTPPPPTSLFDFLDPQILDLAQRAMPLVLEAMEIRQQRTQRPPRELGALQFRVTGGEAQAMLLARAARYEEQAKAAAAAHDVMPSPEALARSAGSMRWMAEHLVVDCTYVLSAPSIDFLSAQSIGLLSPL